MRLIDADALWMDVIHSMDYCDDILEIIERQPTIEERKMGKWIPTKRGERGYSKPGFRCDQCKDVNLRTNYCPSCGAEMEGSE